MGQKVSQFIKWDSGSLSDDPNLSAMAILRQLAGRVTALLEQYDESPYAVRSRVGFVLKRRLHQDSIERQTR